MAGFTPITLSSPAPAGRDGSRSPMPAWSCSNSPDLRATTERPPRCSPDSPVATGPRPLCFKGGGRVRRPRPSSRREKLVDPYALLPAWSTLDTSCPTRRTALPLTRTQLEGRSASASALPLGRCRRRIILDRSGVFLDRLLDGAAGPGQILRHHDRMNLNACI